jgi:biopolymer transport protein ExbD
MNFRRGRGHEVLEINLVPLIDVLLVIIIFLVVSATFSRINELQINLPTAEANQQQDKPVVVNVGIDANGRTEINNAAVANPGVETLTLALRKAAGNGKEPTVIISADAKTTHQSVITVMEAARQAGLTHITFATQSSGS